MANAMRVLVWDENKKSVPTDIYPGNLRTAIADGLNKLGNGQIEATPAHLDEANQGITASVSPTPTF